MRSRLIGPAVPIHYQSVGLGEGSSNLTLPAETANVDMDIGKLYNIKFMNLTWPNKGPNRCTTAFTVTYLKPHILVDKAR